jgi:hypothetical protein
MKAVAAWEATSPGLVVCKNVDYNLSIVQEEYEHETQYSSIYSK